jgi:hypothetical protein
MLWSIPCIEPIMLLMCFCMASMSDEHFTVDGTLIEGWAGQKSFRRKDEAGSGGGGDFHGEPRSNQTHVVEHGSRGPAV